MESNHRFLGVDQASLPLDHGAAFLKWTHRESHPDLQRAELASSCWTMSPISALSGRRGTRTPKRLAPPPVFGTGSSSGRMPSVFHKLRGLESNQRPPHFRARRHYQQQLPRIVWNQRHVVCVAVRVSARGGGVEPPSPGSKPGGLPLADPRSSSCRVPCGSRTRLARLEAWHLCRSAKGT